MTERNYSAEVGTQEVMAAWWWVYDEQDRCELGLSNCWQCWWQDRSTQRVVCFVPVLQQPPSTVSPWQRGRWLQGFCDGLWRRHSARADGKCVMCFSAIVSVYLRAVYGYVLDMCVEDDWQDFMPAWFKCIDVLAAVQHKKKRNLKADGHCPWPSTKLHKGCIYSCIQLNGLWLSVQ